MICLINMKSIQNAFFINLNTSKHLKFIAIAQYFEKIFVNTAGLVNSDNLSFFSILCKTIFINVIKKKIGELS